jgi:hypothetical protein
MTLLRAHGELEGAGAAAAGDVLALRGLDASSLSGLLDGAAAIGRLRAVGDLTLGGWRAHQLAHELCAQLHLSPVAEPAGRPLTGASSRSLAGLIAYGIDSESRGDAAATLAARVARRVAGALAPGDLVVVLAARFGASWEREDVLLVEALACEAQDAGWHLRIGVGDPASELPGGWRVDGAASGGAPGVDDAGLAALVPGVVPAGLAPPGSLGLAGALSLVAPERRRSPASVGRMRYDELTAATRGWARAYAQVHGNNVFVDPEQLVSEAWRQFAAGAPGIALRLAGHATTAVGDPHERAAIEIQAQGMRIGAMRYADAARSAGWPARLDARLSGLLSELKGWGLTLGDDPAGIREGARLLAGARRLLGEVEPRESLYLSNILALSALKTGDAPRALMLELDIERALDAGIDDACMTYVNALNLARLRRREGDLAEARRQFERAFATTDGQRSETDRVYANVCLARVEEEAGDKRAALACWLRASLHLLCARDPQALSRRALTALLGQPPPCPRLVPAAVARALCTRLATAAASAGADAGSARGAAPRVVPAAALAEGQVGAAVGDAGWGILVCIQPPASWPARAPWCDRALTPLSLAVGALLAALAPETPLAGATWLALDDRDGRELPADEGALRASAARYGAQTVCFAGRRDLLGAAERRRVQLAQRLSLGSAVRATTPAGDGIEVSFTRHRSPVHVSGAGARLIARLADGGCEVRAACSLVGLEVDDGIALAYRLAAERLVAIDSVEAPCTAAGSS